MFNWSAEILEFASKTKNTHALSWQQVAEIVETDFDIDTSDIKDVGGALRKAVARYHAEPSTIPENTAPDISPVLTLPYRNVLVLYDLHAGFHHRQFVTQMVRLARMAGITDLVTDSDLFDLGSVSKYPKTTKELSLDDDLEAAGKLLHWLGNYFKVWMMHANHGMRLSKRLDAPLDLSRLVSMSLNGRSADVTTTNREYFVMDDFYFGHPSEMRGGSVVGKVAYQLAIRHNKNTLTGHTHQAGFMYTPNGKLGLEVGCCVDSGLVGYKNQSCNAMRDFTLGAALIIDGDVYHFDAYGNTQLNGNNKRSFDYWEDYFSNE